MVVNDLYYGPVWRDTIAPIKAEASTVSISDEIIAAALRNIYRRDFNPHDDIEPNLFNTIAQTLGSAVTEGFSAGSGSAAAPSLGQDPFLHALRHSTDVFAAFKTHRAQNDMAARLLDSDGNLKPFKQWKEEVLPIASHQCNNWLQTEYNTAVLRARQAANWQQFQREKDILPNLKWLPSTSPHPGEDHQPFWNTILPVDHPFWDQHRPGDRWNCKCDLISTDEPTTSVPSVATQSQPQNTPQSGLKSNPGKTAKIFSDDHPYIANAHEGAEEAVEKFFKENFTQEIKGEQDVIDFLNFRKETTDWFKRGFSKLDGKPARGNNGETDLKGHISLKPEILKNVISGLEKSRLGKEITKDEAQAFGTFWHEITHNRTKTGEILTKDGTSGRYFMEVANEFVARRTLPEFYKGIGAKMQFEEFMVSRGNCGYNTWVLRYQRIINDTGCDMDKALQSVKQFLFEQPLDKQQDGLIKALKLQGARKKDGTLIKDGDLRKLVTACIRKEYQFKERYESIIGLQY